MPLKIVTLPATRMLWLSGTVCGQRIRESTRTDDPLLAEERRAVREAEVYRAAIHGLKAVRPFAEVALNYLKRPRSDDTRWRLGRFLLFLRNEGLESIRCERVDQELLDHAYERMLRPGAKDATRLREVVSPVRAVLRHGAIRGWCAPPVFEIIRQAKGRKEWLTPSEAESIVAASPPHLAPLFEFMFCAGPRRSEILSLDWQNVQLDYSRATLRDIKARPGEVKDRILDLEPRAVAALKGVWEPGRKGPVFRRRDGTLWNSDTRVSGAQLNCAFQEIAAARIVRPVHLHMIRHSWASWHYAVHKDLKKLMKAGAWDSLAMADRYTHLAPDGMIPEILAFWRGSGTDPFTNA
jgi:integrase